MLRFLAKLTIFGAFALEAVLAGAASGSQQSFLADGHSLLESTHLIEVQQGSELSNRVHGAGPGGFESAHGHWVSLDRWYRSRWTDARFTWMTQVTPNLGVLWGVSTGERGEKYAISPSVKMGVVFQTQLHKRGYLSVKGTTILGGSLKEQTCVADYGDIGGVQEVNCRLAATVLEPSETLRYMYNDKPRRHAFLIQYAKFF